MGTRRSTQRGRGDLLPGSPHHPSHHAPPARGKRHRSKGSPTVCSLWTRGAECVPAGAGRCGGHHVGLHARGAVRRAHANASACRGPGGAGPAATVADRRVLLGRAPRMRDRLGSRIDEGDREGARGTGIRRGGPPGADAPIDRDARPSRFRTGRGRCACRRPDRPARWPCSAALGGRRPWRTRRGGPRMRRRRPAGYRVTGATVRRKPPRSTDRAGEAADDG